VNRRTSPSATSAPSSSPRRWRGRGGTSTPRCERSTPSPPAGSWCAAGRPPAATPGGPTTSSSTSPASRSPSSRPRQQRPGGRRDPAGLEYADLLKVPFAFASNGDGFLAHDGTGLAEQPERYLGNDEFPSPTSSGAGSASTGASPARPRRSSARTITPTAPTRSRAITSSSPSTGRRGRRPQGARVLLVMATGTGKTYTAFQIIWRLWKAGVKKRILFLADRNILIDQTKNNDFKPFGGKMTKITDRKVDKSYEVYLALYQAITGADEARDIFRQFSRDFFDLVVIDECHAAAPPRTRRGARSSITSSPPPSSASPPRPRRPPTSRPRTTSAIRSIRTRSRRDRGRLPRALQGRARRYRQGPEGWRPPRGSATSSARRSRIASMAARLRPEPGAGEAHRAGRRKISDYLKATDRFAKTIVFCEDIDHANRMRSALANENADLCHINRKYVMQITGDNDEGKAELYNFTHPEQRYPVIAPPRSC